VCVPFLLMVSNQTFLLEEGILVSFNSQSDQELFSKVFSVIKFGNGLSVCSLKCTNTLFMYCSDIGSAIRSLQDL
jgi:hypothetical protein